MKTKIIIVAIIAMMLFTTINIVAEKNNYDSELIVTQTIWDEQTNSWVEDIDAEIGDVLRVKIRVKYVIYDSTNEPYYWLYVTNINVKDVLYSGLEYRGNAEIKYFLDVYYGESEIDGNIIEWHITEDYGIKLYDHQSFTIEFDAVVTEPGVHINHAKSSVIEKCSGQSMIDYDNANINVVGDTTPPETECELIGVEGFDNWFLSDVEVVLTAYDEISDWIVIVYQINDGRWYNVSDDIVSFIIEEEGTHIVRYYSVDESGNHEQIKTRSFKIDKTKPDTEYLINGSKGENNWYLSDVCLKLMGSDDLSGIKSIYYKINDGEFLKYKDYIQLKDSGIYRIEFYSVDCAGNIGNRDKIKILIDKDKPVTNAILPKTDEYYDEIPIYRTMISISLDAKDDMSGIKNTLYRLILNPMHVNTWKEYKNPILITKRGLYTLEFYSNDCAGNIEEIKQVEFIVLI